MDFFVFLFHSLKLYIMGVFKEHARAFEAIAEKGTQIYSDAADYGYPYNTKNIPSDVQLLINYVNDLKGSSLITSRIETISGVDITIQIGWEIDEGFECGTQYDISFNRIGKTPSNIHKDCNSFISVDIKPYRKPYRG